VRDGLWFLLMGYRAPAISQPGKGLPLCSTHNSTSGSSGVGSNWRRRTTPCPS